MRKAFSMLTAIFIIVLMAIVAAFIMNLSGKMVKGTTSQFQREQSVLLAKSYTEYAIMAVMANDHNSSSCLNEITGAYGKNGDDDVYSVTVNIFYIGRGLNDSCNLVNETSNIVTTEESPLNIIVDVFVRYKELDHPDPDSAPNVTYHKRSLQKI